MRMYKSKNGQILKFVLSLSLIIVSLVMQARIEPTMFDGPYIFNQEDSLRIQWVEKGIGHDTLIAKKDANEFRRNNLPVVDLQDLDFVIEDKVSFDSIDKVVALSDVHGQYDILLTLLQNHNIIDKDGHWVFSENHLVIVGDNFDRGPKVLDILWFLFKLQKEAYNAGGRVHVLLGNHEIMVLNGDLRYLNKKYYYTSAVFTTKYDQFFRKGSILGDWITQHKAVISINKSLFVHGGMSPSIVKMGYSLKEINQVFEDSLIRQSESSILDDDKLALMYMEEGPLWYRGYFDTSAINNKSVDTILQTLGQEHLVIGHTSQDKIKPLFNSKIIVIDCSIKLGKTGQLLISENGEFEIGEIDGTRKILHEKQTLFDYIYNLDGLPHLEINTEVKKLINKSHKEEYQMASLRVRNTNGSQEYYFSGEVRARGKMRKKVCRFPPLKYNIPKAELTSQGFVNIDKLKFVFPCRNRSSDDKYNSREFFLYELYNLIDTNCIKAKRVNFSLIEDGKEKYNFVGFLVEDEDEYAYRKNARIVESGRIQDTGLDREPFLKMLFFQYMIANTDFALGNKHNLELVKLPDIDRVVALPYDFDYSGFVGQSYAVPHESLPIKSVQERYFFNYKITEEEYLRMVEYFLSLENDIYKFCDDATYMSEKTIRANKSFLKEFFDLLRAPKWLKREMIKG